MNTNTIDDYYELLRATTTLPCLNSFQRPPSRICFKLQSGSTEEDWERFFDLITIHPTQMRCGLKICPNEYSTIYVYIYLGISESARSIGLKKLLERELYVDLRSWVYYCSWKKSLGMIWKTLNNFKYIHIHHTCDLGRSSSWFTCIGDESWNPPDTCYSQK